MIEGFVPWPAELMREYSDKGHWLGLTVGETFDRTAGEYSNAEILVAEGVRFTYSELGLLVRRLALGLLELGLKREESKTMRRETTASVPRRQRLRPPSPRRPFARKASGKRSAG